MNAEHWRWLLRTNTPTPRSVGLVGIGLASFALLLAAPWVAGQLDRRGLPGGALVLGSLVIGIGLVLRAQWTTVPGGRHRRRVMRWARDRGSPFRSGFTLPASLREVTSLSNLRMQGGVANLVVVNEGDEEILVFDRWRAAAEGLEEAEWRTVAAVRAPIDVPRLVVHPRGHAFRVPRVDAVIREIDHESGAFDRRYRVLAEDRAAAVALIDQRMMAWLLASPGDVTFEAAGPWLAASTPAGDPALRDDLVAAVIELRERLPRVSPSLYPPRDPGFDRPRG